MSLQSQIDILALGLCSINKSIKAITPKITITNNENKTTQTFTGDSIVSVNDANENGCTTYNPDAGTCVDIMCGEKSILNDKNTIIESGSETITSEVVFDNITSGPINSCTVSDDSITTSFGDLSKGDKLVFSGNVTLSEDQKTITLPEGTYVKFYDSSCLENTNLIQPYYQRTLFDNNNITKIEDCIIIVKNSA